MTAAALGLLAALACLLYLPFLGNPALFDDRYVFSGYRFAEHAVSPLALALRQPANFSLAVVQVFWGSMEAHRLASLLAHVACAWALYALLLELQRGCAADDSPRARLLAFSGAALFAVHPAAVYAAGYLVQRSIVLATLFGLLSAVLFLRGLRRRRYADALSGAALFSLAVLCKEHAILVPAAAATGVFLARTELRFALRYTAGYFAACAPVALLVVLMAKGIFGERYEPDFDAVAAQITQAHWNDAAENPWVGSAMAQASLFFRYLALWLWPRTGAMAFDLRVDFAELWAPGVALPAMAGFLACAALGAYLLGRRGRYGMAGFGLLWFWILFLAEFSVIRFQEPFVLYRSYLWAPGLAVMLVAALGGVRLRVAAVTILLAVPLLVVQSYDRLRTLASGIAAWEDAAAKLPPEPIPGGWRTLYNLGREYLYAEMPQKAIATAERCMAEYPGTYHCFLARASINLVLEEHAAAIPYLLHAIAARPQEGVPRHHLGFALEELGCREQARAQYQLAYKLGFAGARYRLESMDSPGSGLLPPSRAARRAGPCPPAIRSATLPPG